MEMNLRQAVIQRVQGKNEEDLQEIIEDSVGGAEMALPGLGVLFELIWEHSAPEDRDKMALVLQQHVNQPGTPAG